ncbi:MAG: FliI/YscN family ATPase [Halioglobus sp.]|nr:FliI/YscN family ATPase [Halioglobus sp.]MCB1708250.1 FliI/YscN family ATPase [Halioglobus sp.]MCP5120965.1 FliI/YscN family ATPase [Pseudomonadales bacterium]MCP5194407.1 FliI/YscN family ATPase [Pseudomonadales bacterium]
MQSAAAEYKAQHSDRVAGHLRQLADSVSAVTLQEEGSLVRMIGIKLEAIGCQAPIGRRCRIITDEGGSIEAEVVGFSDGTLYLMPEGSLRGVKLGARVVPLKSGGVVAVDEQLLGRVIDGAGKPIDGGGTLRCSHHVPLRGPPLNPLQRSPITEPLDVGVRAINALLTLGKGQRLGLFAGSGVGKSTLLGMMTRHTEADVIVVALVGERGREVREFVDDILGPHGMAKAIVVATPADDLPLMRVHGAWRATAIAEYFGARGKKVLLLMDSLTRVAQAQREIGLAVGEPPVSKGYPPSVFSLLPALVERVGNGVNGSITAVYTVLVEGGDFDDPVSDASRAILDGHIVLSREVAESGLFPAIDIDSSVSRLMTSIVDEDQLLMAREIKSLYSSYQQNRDLINIGAYQKGTDELIDRAIVAAPRIRNFIAQDESEKTDMNESLAELSALFASSAVVMAGGKS